MSSWMLCLRWFGRRLFGLGEWYAEELGELVGWFHMKGRLEMCDDGVDGCRMISGDEKIIYIGYEKGFGVWCDMNE